MRNFNLIPGMFTLPDIFYSKFFFVLVISLCCVYYKIVINYHKHNFINYNIHVCVYKFQPLHGHLQAVQSRNSQTTTNILGVKISQDSQEELCFMDSKYHINLKFF